MAQLLFQQLSLLRPGMTPQENSFLLRAILSLPKDIQALLAMLGSQGETSVLADLLTQTTTFKLPLETLQVLLSGQSKDALGQLIKLIQQNQLATISPEATNDLAQMKELLGVLSKLSEQVNRSPVDALKTLMLLYIPFYPLTGEQRLNLSFGWQDDEDSPVENDEPLLILYLQTNHLGRFRIVVMEEAQHRLLFMVQHETVATHYVPDIEAQLKNHCHSDHLPEPGMVWSVFAATPSEPSASDASCETGSETAALGETSGSPSSDMTVIPTEGVSLVVINGGYQLARIILEMDNRLAQL